MTIKPTTESVAMTETSMPRGQANTKLSLTIPVNNRPADGSAADTAKAVLTHKGSGKPVPDRWITFQVTAGSATFPNGNTQKTSSDGSAQVDFTDTTADAAGEMIAYLTDNTDVQSNLASYSFTTTPPPGWVLRLNVIVNYQLRNEARATVFEPLRPRMAPRVRFQLDPALVATNYVKLTANYIDIIEMGDGYIVLLAQQLLNNQAKWVSDVTIQATRRLPCQMSGRLTASLPDYPQVGQQTRLVVFNNNATSR